MKVACPWLRPVTIPPLLIDAIEGLLLVHVPPLEGVKLDRLPTQMAALPVRFMVGLSFTVIEDVGDETQPETLLVNVKVAVPLVIPVITPEFVMVATAGLELVQIPPLVGVTVAFRPAHISLKEGLVTEGTSLTTMAIVLLKVEHITPVVVVNLLLNLWVPRPRFWVV